MRNWELIAGATAWVLVATSMASAALQPVEVTAADRDGTRIVSLCADGSPRLAMGCASMHL